MSGDLHSRMLAAHEGPDHAALIALYTEAADSANDLDASCFFLTHAYVFALEAGAPQARHLHGRLARYGREE
ncbi:hypothetical protein SAMN05421666_3073 [Roseovarius nanhaiticus]|uniref:Uncharacterized protein n=1 Tax=Roseovarius nanhaiticus TaxID=573024 RepID=A0A1N7HHP7_9RHOB|nr:hypothetical protein [Roseovarius nanhaiticus]SEK94015.1 hypothetical protein SAMN05216208_2243 [Roseovarius nanhaiticus]SIS24303.1 hypothetical protein SAMN05421666_3073 [Roseovarius nanhaiticus]